MIDYSVLKSGTDIRGTGLAVNGNTVQLSDDAVFAITAAFVRYLQEEKGNSAARIAVGCDSRLSSPRIKSAVIDTLCSLGVTAVDCSLASTPAMFMTTVNFGCDAAVQITASHLPYEMNGLKFFTRAGGFSGSDIEKILRTATNNAYLPNKRSYACEKADYMSVYSDSLAEMIKKALKSADYDRPLAGMKIVVDAGNGVGGFFVNNVLEPLGADCSGSVFLEPDGHFPNHIPNPEDKTAMLSVKNATIAASADLGVIFDTDVDRAGCVSSDGEELNRNRLVALASYIALKDVPGGTIVTDSVTSDGLTDYINNTLGGIHRRFKRGYKNVIDESVRLESLGVASPLAIETSGHAAFSSNYFLDDGAYLITRIIIEAARLYKSGGSLADIIKDLAIPAEEREIRYRILLDDFKDYGIEVIACLEKTANEASGISVCPDNFEGVRLSFSPENGDGWLLLRMSVHEPLLVMNCESASEGGTGRILDWFTPFIEKWDKVKKK